MFFCFCFHNHLATHQVYLAIPCGGPDPEVWNVFGMCYSVFYTLRNTQDLFIVICRAKHTILYYTYSFNMHITHIFKCKPYNISVFFLSFNHSCITCRPPSSLHTNNLTCMYRSSGYVHV